jgi:hypothetical protein
MLSPLDTADLATTALRTASVATTTGGAVRTATADPA